MLIHAGAWEGTSGGIIGNVELITVKPNFHFQNDMSRVAQIVRDISDGEAHKRKFFLKCPEIV